MTLRGSISKTRAAVYEAGNLEGDLKNPYAFSRGEKSSDGDVPSPVGFAFNGLADYIRLAVPLVVIAGTISTNDFTKRNSVENLLSPVVWESVRIGNDLIVHNDGCITVSIPT